jgi:hypothetical protein
VVDAPPTSRDFGSPAAAGDVRGAARLAYFTPVHEQPTLADRKAMFILGASGLMVSVLLFFSHSLYTLAQSGGAAARAAVFGALVAVGILVVIAAVIAYYSYTRSLPQMPPTFAWFRNVGATTVDEYSRHMLALDHPAALREMLHYNYSVASLAARKFRLVNRSIRCLRVAIPLWMVLLLTLAAWG